jgi:hypothetical protein
MLRKLFILLLFSFIVYANNKGAISGLADLYGNDKGALTSYFTADQDSFSITVYEVPPRAFEHYLSASKIDTGDACSLFVTVNVGYDGTDIYGDTACPIVQTGKDTIIFPAVEADYTVYIRGKTNLSYFFDMAAGDFSLCVIPDVQLVTKSATWVTYWDSTCNWIKRYYDTYNMKSIILLGDLLDETTTDNCVQAKPGVDTLKSIGEPILFTPGNHDYNAPTLLDSIDKYHFDRSWYAAQEWFNGELYSGTSYADNMFFTFTHEGITYLLTGAEWDADAAVLSWTRHITDSLLSYYNIFSTHGYITPAGNKTHEYMWDTLEQCSNLKAILCGHQTGNYDTIEVASTGQSVNVVLQNYQQDFEGGRATIRMYIFKPSKNLIDIFTYTPYFDSLTTTALHDFSVQFSDSITITISDSTNGSIIANPGFDMKMWDSVELTATADAGYYFSAWTDDTTTSTNPLNWQTLLSDKTVGAAFVDSPTIVSMVNLNPLTGWPTDAFVPGDTFKVTTTGMQAYGGTTEFRLNSTGTAMGTILSGTWDEDEDTCWIKTPTGLPSGVYFSRYRNNDGVRSLTDGRKCEVINPGSD